MSEEKQELFQEIANKLGMTEKCTRHQLKDIRGMVISDQQTYTNGVLDMVIFYQAEKVGLATNKEQTIIIPNPFLYNDSTLLQEHIKYYTHQIIEARQYQRQQMQSMPKNEN